MRSISKGGECQSLRNWKRLNATSSQNIHYDNLGRDVKEAMLTKLLKEQGGLCAYTMKRIAFKAGAWQAHIEHILPRSQHPDLSVSWGNLLACVPQPGVACDYGAKRKDAYDPAQKPFVNPTRAGVSAHFRFREGGEVDGLTPEAIESIGERVLHLNHRDLVNDRKGKISGALCNKPSAASARRRAQELRKSDINGNLEPYCEAVAQVLEAYATRLENRAARIAGANRK